MIVRARRTSPPSRWTWRVVGVDPRDRARDEDLGAEPPRLLQRAARELVAGHAGREAEVVLDPRRRAGLAAGRLALDHDRAQPLGRAVHRGGEPGRARRRRSPCRTRQRAARCRGRAARRPGAAAAGRRSCRRRRGSPGSRPPAGSGPPHCSAASGVVRREPRERDLVAVEEAPQLGARAVPATRRRRSRAAAAAPRRALQPARPPIRSRGELADLLADLGRDRGDRVVVVRLDPHHARRLGGPEADREDGAERDRHLAEDVARLALADDALDRRRRA